MFFLALLSETNCDHLLVLLFQGQLGLAMQHQYLMPRCLLLTKYGQKGTHLLLEFRVVLSFKVQFRVVLSFKVLAVEKN